MSSPSRWLTWKPARTLLRAGVPPATKPTKPSKPAADPHNTPEAGGSVGFEGFVPPSVAADATAPVTTPVRLSAPANRRSGPLYPEPTWGRTVTVSFASGDAKLTVVRHNLRGENRFGQNAAKFPFCVISYLAWREFPFDLRGVHWYRTADDAAGVFSAPPAEDARTEIRALVAHFAEGIDVELWRQSKRWLMWVTQRGKRNRRKDFASPYLEHAQRTAEEWYGKPLDGWHEPQEGKH
jgi:hypothetical protein